MSAEKNKNMLLNTFEHLDLTLRMSKHLLMLKITIGIKVKKKC